MLDILLNQVSCTDYIFQLNKYPKFQKLSHKNPVHRDYVLGRDLGPHSNSGKG